VLPLVLAIGLAVPAGIYALFRKKVPDARRLCTAAFAAGVLLAVGLLLEFQYFPIEYFQNGGGVFLALWRLLIQLAWIAALYGLFLAVTRRASLFGLGGLGAAVRSFFVVALALGFMAIVVLVPYWGLLLNFTH
jgi:hypothetical protein